VEGVVLGLGLASIVCLLLEGVIDFADHAVLRLGVVVEVGESWVVKSAHKLILHVDLCRQAGDLSFKFVDSLLDHERFGVVFGILCEFMCPVEDGFVFRGKLTLVELVDVLDDFLHDCCIELLGVDGSHFELEF